MLRSSGAKETQEDNEYLYYNSVCNMLEMFSKHRRLYSLPKNLCLKRQCKDKAQQKATYGILSKMIHMMVARTEEERTSFSFFFFQLVGLHLAPKVAFLR